MTNATFETAKVQAVRNYRTASGVDESQIDMYPPQNNAAEDDHL